MRLIRHGQTQGYITDGALTPLGHWQAHRKGQDLAKGMKEGMTVRFPHARTRLGRRRQRSAVRSGVLQALSSLRHPRRHVEDPFPLEAFKNFQVWAGGREVDVTAAFQEFAQIHEGYQRFGVGDRPGWITEMNRFYRVQFAGGDPITVWLTNPSFYFEPPDVRRAPPLAGDPRELSRLPEGGRLFVCGHSGPIRAVAASAVGHDPGEPHNTEDVRIRVHVDREHATLTYRGRAVEIDIPTLVTPTWFR